jgi:hypothetical protein
MTLLGNFVPSDVNGTSQLVGSLLAVEISPAKHKQTEISHLDLGEPSGLIPDDIEGQQRVCRVKHGDVGIAQIPNGRRGPKAARDIQSQCERSMTCIHEIVMIT